MERYVFLFFSVISLHELVQHGKNGMVFRDSTELATQMMVSVRWVLRLKEIF